jgi:hypothetical protein
VLELLHRRRVEITGLSTEEGRLDALYLDLVRSA